MQRWLPVWIFLAAVAGAVAMVTLRESDRRETSDPPRPAAAAPATQSRPVPLTKKDAGEPGADAPVGAEIEPDVEDFLPDPDSPDAQLSKVNVKDPDSVTAYRDYHERQARNNAERLAPILYEDAPRELGLGKEKFQAMLAILVEENARANSVSHALNQDQATRARQLAELREDRESQLTTLLGSDGMAGLKRHRQTIDARIEVQELVEALEPSRHHVSETQRRRLVGSLVKPGAYLPNREYSPSESPAAVRQEVLARVEQNEQLLLDAARPILESRQLDAYAKFLAERREEAIIRATPYFARELKGQ